MRIVMMGTGPFAVPTFLSLLESPHEVLALFTRPSPPVKGRGPAPPNPMRDVAETRGLPVFAPDSVNSDDAQQTLRSLRPDLLVVCDYGQILKAATLAIAPLGGINLHGSLLPKYRGAAPINWAVWNGDAETGITVIHMTPKLDGGPMLSLRVTPIGENETTAELEPRLSQLGVPAVHEAIAQLAAWDRVSTIGQLQDPALATPAPRLKKTDGAVNWQDSAERIRNQVRALKPWPGTYSHWQRLAGEPLRLILETVSVPLVASETVSAAPGTVVRADGQTLWIATGSGPLSLEQLQPAGKRVLAVNEFLRGYPVRVGEHFVASATTA